MRTVVAAVIAAIAVLQAPAPRTSPPDREAAYRANNVGVARLEQFAYDEAAKAFRDALRLAPDLAIARLNLAIAEFYGGHPDEAAADARAAADRMPASAAAHYVVGLIATRGNRPDEAAAAFGRVLQLDPRDAGALIFLGQVHLQQRRYAEALALFDRAVAAEPYNVTAAYNAALALTRAGRPEEGRAAMQRFERLRDSVYGITYGQTYLSQGRYGEAIASTGAEPDLVNPATPAVTFSDQTATAFAAPPPNSAASGTAGGITLFDADGDGTLDLVSADAAGLRLFRNTRGRFADDTARAGFGSVPEAAGVIAGDYDNDGRPDLFVMSAGGPRLFHQKADATFEDVTRAAALPSSPPSAGTAAFADIDHDGDLDIIVAGQAAQVLRNNGNGTFTDITAASGFGGPLGRAVAIAPTDYDNRRDLDVLIAASGRAPLLFRNLRDGTFRESAADAGLATVDQYSALAVADVNKDGYPDIFLGRRDGPGLLALSDGQGRFQTGPAPDASRAAIAAQFVDYDNDGLLDLLTMSEGAVRLFRNVGRGQWTDVGGAAGVSAVAPGGTSAFQAFQSVALGDLDNDGDTDVSIRMADGRLRVLRNDGGDRNASLHVRLAARASNRSAAGTRVELRAGSLRQMLETSSSSPAVSPADLVFGLGARTGADVVRVLWPSGILQAETGKDGRTITITELDRKPSSCPYLFTWNGTRFAFVTDFMGGGEMGDWVGPGTWNDPDPVEYVRIRADQLKPRNGRYELRVTNELEEALFIDRLRLVAVDHATGVEAYPNEGLVGPPAPAFSLTTTRGARPPVAATDDQGRNVLSRIAAIDRQYADGFALSRIRGYAESHALTLDLGPAADRAVLLFTGWTDYAFSGDNVAAHQSGQSLLPPALQVRDGRGAWRTVIDNIGIPVGRPQTVVVNLSGKIPKGTREVRLVTNMRIYWDQVLVDVSGGGFPTVLTRLDPLVATLRWRGFSAESSPDGRAPYGYDYDRVSTVSPWKVLTGRYTREGDVRPLLTRRDDMFVVSRPGDEVALSFDAKALPALRRGMTRTFLLYADGYSKEMDINSASPHTVEPLPFHGMSGYPYGSAERYPRTPAHLRYLERYNTRTVSRPLPPLEAVK